MSDRISSPVSSSPGRSTLIARPAWPWQPSSLRPSSSTSSLDHRNSYLGSLRSTSRTHSSSSSVMWQSTSTAPTIGPMSKKFQEESTRQWSFIGFEWTVRDVHKLRDFVEGVNALEVENPDFDILKESPMIGDNKFKLEITFTPPQEGSSDAQLKPTLSLYITSLMVDFSKSGYELSASMMAAISCQADRAGERGSPPEWVWDSWEMNWVFRQEHEVWECPLPPLSALLENSRIRETDSMVICVQIHCPSGPSFPQQPSVHSVPRDLLDGLEASLDNANTGDVRFICLERLNTETPTSPAPVQDATTPTTLRSLSQTSSFSVRTARKRIIYAHSDILIRRSEYFATMLASSFSENSPPVVGERKVYTIVVDEADFETIYWLLKFCYANWLRFREYDDPRTAMDGIGAGWSAKWPSLRGGEWDWKTFPKDDDTRSVTSGETRLSTSESRVSGGMPETLQSSNPTSVPVSPSTTRSVLPISKLPLTTTPSPSQSSSTSRRTIPPSPSASTASSGSTTVPRPKSITGPVINTNYVPPPRPGYPLSPRAGRQHPSTASAPDPHPHPTPAPRPASALSMYQIAHRYAIPGLATLALEHIMTSLTPQSSFALLLATSVWDELHLLIEDYVVEKWDEVSVSEEFEQCCQEVAAGEWASDGGKTLTSIFRRLRAPHTLA